MKYKPLFFLLTFFAVSCNYTSEESHNTIMDISDKITTKEVLDNVIDSTHHVSVVNSNIYFIEDGEVYAIGQFTSPSSLVIENYTLIIIIIISIIVGLVACIIIYIEVLKTHEKW